MNKKSINKSSIIIIILFFIISFLLLLKSPLHIWNHSTINTDSSVFKMIAIMMNNGYMPYLNTFDHKGPLLYIIEYLGLLIEPYRGVWFLEFISIYITNIYLYKICRLKCNKFASFLITFLSISMLFIYIEGGNLCEEYALPFISISLFYLLDYIINNKVNKIRILICGLSFSSILMIRPNMISTWVVFCIYILFICIKNKDYKSIKEFILYFLLGSLIIIIPILLWLIINKSFNSFINDYILFNIKYSNTILVDKEDFLLLKIIMFYMKKAVLLLSIIFTIMTIRKNKKFIIYLIYSIVSLIFIFISKNPFHHYMIIYIPVIVLPYAEVYSLINNKYKNIIYFVITLFILSLSTLTTWINLIVNLPSTYNSRNINKVDKELLTISKIIKKETNKNDKISVYGNNDFIYILSDRLHATKYSYQFPLIKVSKEIKKDYFKELNKEKPKIMVLQKNDKNIYKFLNNNNYKLIWNNSNYKIYKYSSN